MEQKRVGGHEFLDDCRQEPPAAISTEGDALARSEINRLGGRGDPIQDTALGRGQLPKQVGEPQGRVVQVGYRFEDDRLRPVLAGRLP